MARPWRLGGIGRPGSTDRSIVAADNPAKPPNSWGRGNTNKPAKKHVVSPQARVTDQKRNPTTSPSKRDVIVSTARVLLLALRLAAQISSSRRPCYPRGGLPFISNSGE